MNDEKTELENIICLEEKEKDYEGVEKVIISDKYREWKNTENNEWKNIRRLRNSPIYDNRFSLIAEIDQKIVGHIVLVDARVSECNDIKFLNFIQQSIHAEYQGRGIGTKLMKTVESIAKSLSYSGIFALGHKEFFPNLGYEKVEESGQWKWIDKEQRPLFFKKLDTQSFFELHEDEMKSIVLYDIRDFDIERNQN